MRSFEIKVYPELLTGHLGCDPDTAMEFLDWVEESQIELWEPGSVDHEGNYRPLNVEKRRLQVKKDLHQQRGTPSQFQSTTLWFLGPPDSALLLKLRWNDHFV